MPRSISVIRRYTPPTCTLEVLAQSSPLSRWIGKTVLKQVSFELRFDDPRLPEERRITIRGDRDQLEALCDTVASYVQQFLQQPPETFWVSFSTTSDSSQVSEADKLADSAQVPRTLKPTAAKTPGTHIHLEPSSSATHQLFLGPLANQVSGPSTQLTLLQLFDLATALDEYSVDVMTLPTLEGNSSSQSLPRWAPVAAVLVVSVFFTPLTWHYANSIRQQQQQTAKMIEPAKEKIALAPSPAVEFPPSDPRITAPNHLASFPIFAPNASPSPNPNLSSKPLTLPNSSPIPKASVSSLNQEIPKISKPQAHISIRGNSRPNPTPPRTQITIPADPLQDSTAFLPPEENLLPHQSKILLPPSITTITSNIPTAAYTPHTTSPSVNSLVARLKTANQTPISTRTPISTNVATISTLVDTHQVSEAKEYLKQRWQPPQGFTETLEYSLDVGVDGSLQRILPLNQAARQYVDQAGIPQIGKPFVSANKNGQSIRIRVVLTPDGKVMTFLES